VLSSWNGGAVADPNVAPRTPKRKHEKAASPNSKTNLTYAKLNATGRASLIKGATAA